MAEYLDKFKDLIKKRQATQILNLLNKKKNTGEVRTIEEFTQRLDTLIRDITNTTLTPTLKIYMALANGEISSEVHNEMLDRASDDLDAAFEEAGNINEVQESHQAIVKDVVLKNLRYGIAELESKVSLYEFLSKDTNGFESAIFSTFRESREARSPRTLNQASSIFVDPRNNLGIQDDAVVDPVGERLTLSLDSKTYYDLRSARQIFDSESKQSTLIVEPPTSKLSNLIDGRSGTYWTQSLLFDEQQPFVKTKLEFDISGTRDINFIEIEPASKFEVILESIFYLDTNNIITKLGDIELPLSSPLVVQFSSITTKRFILVFRNTNFTKTQFEYNPNVKTLMEQSVDEKKTGTPPNMDTINDSLNGLLANPSIKSMLSITPSPQTKFSGYEYQVGFDNIRVGLGSYDTKSIYVSKSLSLDNIGQIGLRTEETRPGSTGPTVSPDILDTTYDAGDDIFFHSSIEYWVIKEDLDSNGNILSINKFPILPMGVKRVNHERLVLTEKSVPGKITNDAGYTMFFTNPVDGEVKVYRNGLLLSNGNTPDGWQDESQPIDSTPNNGNPMRMKIRIVDPLPTDIFTVTYTPLTSNTVGVPKLVTAWTPNGLNIVDLIGDLSARSINNQVVVLDRTTNADKITSSVIFLSIVIRSNTSDTTLTAAVEEYTLAIGSKDSTKFEGETL